MNFFWFFFFVSTSALACKMSVQGSDAFRIKSAVDYYFVKAPACRINQVSLEEKLVIIVPTSRACHSMKLMVGNDSACKPEIKEMAP